MWDRAGRQTARNTTPEAIGFVGIGWIAMGAILLGRGLYVLFTGSG